ncbi:hypothetical protein SVAN01_05519 [Stagonosporopsis vannaccii]|nr:hypothetical protein SVAN01_05519 [Stagonosporopsis vannaccii]
MVEALAAISLVGNILQFIQFTKGLLETSRAVFDAGATTGHLELEAIAKDLRNRADDIVEPRLAKIDATNGTSDPLKLLALKCKGTADEILTVLARLRLDGNQTRWTSFLQALRTQWHESQIEALRIRLNDIGNAVNVRFSQDYMIDTRAQLDALVENSRRLEDSRTQELLDLKDYFDKALEAHQDRKRESDEDEDAWAKRISAIASKGRQYSAEQVILSLIRFDCLEDRYSDISPAHHSTLTWLFETADTTTFVRWLESDDDLYWISGPPGSGKSTLIKFLYNHESTKRSLQLWAQNSVVVVAGYFFWNAGTNKLQKSQEGLLRSLLYQILRQCPDQIPVVFPSVWKSLNWSTTSPTFDEDLPIDLDQPSDHIPDLTDALARTCNNLTKLGRRFCFFIDGLDEYSGDTADIIGLVGKLRAVQQIKLCVSSRPWIEFDEAYGRSRTMKLFMHDFNNQDINAYIDDIFKHDENYQEMEDRETRGEELKQEIVKAANGVFLWVVLVVRSFQEGLRNGDSITRLQHRLRELPTELEPYFDQILFYDVKPHYRDQAAKLFLVAMRAKETLPLMAYWFLDEQEVPEHHRPLKMQQTNLRHKAAKRRLIASCKGLLEPRNRSSANDDALPSSILFEYKVDFLHRTVRDYLLLPTTNITKWAPREFDPDEAICKAIFSQIKTAPQGLEYGPHVMTLHEIFKHHLKAVAHLPYLQVLSTELATMVDNYGTETVARTLDTSSVQPDRKLVPGTGNMTSFVTQMHENSSLGSQKKSRSMARKWLMKLIGDDVKATSTNRG